MVQKHRAGIERRASQHKRKNISSGHDKSRKKDVVKKEVMLMERVMIMKNEKRDRRSRGKMGIE